MKVIICKRVSLWDGGGRHNFGFFIDCSVTDDAIKEAHPHCAIASDLLRVFDTLDEVQENSVLKARKSAWLKLTPQERLAIGLREEPK